MDKVGQNSTLVDVERQTTRLGGRDGLARTGRTVTRRCEWEGRLVGMWNAGRVGCSVGG